jgi:hypothetical protein
MAGTRPTLGHVWRLVRNWECNQSSRARSFADGHKKARDRIRAVAL